MVSMLFIATSIYAQRTAENFTPIPNTSFTSASVRNEIDTLTPISFIPVNKGGLGCFTGYYNSPTPVMFQKQ